MPDMQGRELADHIRQRFPAVKVLYQTGFSDLLFEDREELEEGAAFLEKPFTARGLREAARLAALNGWQVRDGQSIIAYPSAAMWWTLPSEPGSYKLTVGFDRNTKTKRVEIK